MYTLKEHKQFRHLQEFHKFLIKVLQWWSLRKYIWKYKQIRNTFVSKIILHNYILYHTDPTSLEFFKFTLGEPFGVHRIPTVQMVKTYFLLENIWIPEPSLGILEKFQFLKQKLVTSLWMLEVTDVPAWYNNFNFQNCDINNWQHDGQLDFKKVSTCEIVSVWAALHCNCN